MESVSRNRFQPYARRARQQARQPDRTNEIIQQLPKPLAGFVKRSLQWFGFIQPEEDSDSELDRELHTTNGDFEFLPGADKEHEGQAKETGKDDKASKHQDEEYSKLYPDLRDYLDSLNAKQASQLDSEELAAAMTPEKVAERLRLRKELMDSTKGLPIPIQKNEVTIKKSTQEEATSKDDSPEASEPSVKSAGETLDDMYKAGAALSPAEINLVMRMRRLQKQAPAATSPSDMRLLEDYLPNVNNPIVRSSQESRSTYSQDRRSLDKFPTRSQEHNGHGRSQLRHEPSDVVMSSQSAAEERYDNHTHSHSQSNSRHCACGREVDNEPSAYPGKRTRADRSPTPVSDDEMSSQRGYPQEQEKPKKKRNIRKIPGRFTALDSSDEEEDQRQHDLRVAERRAAQKNHATAYNSSHSTQGVPLYHTPPQIYPTLQYGVRTKLYNPKIDEVLKWTASPPSDPVSLDTWRCPKCEQRTRKTSSTCQFCKAERPEPSIPNTTPISTLKAMMKSDDFKDLKESFTSNPIVSAAISAAPAAFGALATAGVSVGALKAISNLVSESKDLETPKKADASKAPALFPMTTLAPPAAAPSITTSKDADKEPEKEKEKPKSMGTWASIGFKGPDNSGKWKCDVCDSYSLNALDKCGACETPKPGAEPKAAAAVPNMFAVAAANAAAPSSSGSKPAAPALFSFGAPSSSVTPAVSAAPAMFSFGQPSSTPASSASAAPAMDLFAPPAAKPTSTDAASSATNPAGAPGGFVFKASAATPAATEMKPPGSLFGLTSAASAGGNASKAPGLFSMTTPTPATSDSAKPASALISNPFASTTASIASPFAIPATSAIAASAPAPTPSSLFGSTAPAPASAQAASKPTAAPIFSFGASSTSTAPTTPTTPLFSTSASTASPLFGAKPTVTSGAGLFGAGSASTATTTAAISAPLFGASSTTTAAPAFGVTATSTPAPAFGASTTPAPSFFGGASSAAPTSTSLMFGGASSTTSPAKPATSSMFGGTTTPAPLGSTLFGNPAASATTTSAPATGSSMFSFSNPSTTFGAKPTTMPASTAPTFSFGASTPATSAAAAAPASTGFGGFGASSTPGFSMTSPAASAASAAPSPFAFGSATTVPTAAPSFGFGSSTPAATVAPAAAGFAGFGSGSSANPSAGASSSSSPFAFGGNSGTGGFSGFGQTTGASPNTSNASMSMGATPTNPSSGGFGGSAPGGNGFGMFGAAAPGFGASSTTPTIGFGSQSANQSSQASPFGQQGGGGFGGQSTFNSPMGGAGGFGASSGMTGFGASAAPAGGAGAGGFGTGSITIAGGAGSFGSQASGGGVGGFGATTSNNGAFGFQGMPTAPGGSQYTQPAQPAAGGFAFNMGVNTPTPGSERKIAKMRKKRT
ncbi:hypothetical protein KI688_001678 [Linnemannia hyalina]|uniref:RanBP2-type domain-containing protein n=1 Tax=Linnemannia hyalina TaxID=64524 RepID=A0A9P7XSS6_9FUNG|nr:hypothetical protein KI688_001678 [Linnemannia hyalina]